ncbi:heterokaryon incompatibility protein-domain-containing protein [Leptodontidium sp. MPI-SDFR-AT-0119]|nr:heterokaryon incompatibility protein-domain-containing protein [Leptodontidium sp. MPI-SDFR-AT-0119]
MEDPLYRKISGSSCIRCLSMTSTSEGIQALTSDYGYQHHDMKELQNSANLGCPLCHLCCIRIYHSQISFKDRRFLLFHAQLSDGRTPDGRPQFKISKLVFKIRDRTATLATKFEFHAYTSRGNPSAICLQEIDIDLDVAGYDSSEKIRAQLQKCCAKHEQCGKASTPALPSRVIDVGHKDGSTTPKLHVTKHQEFGPYVALSYCWGGQQETTTSKNITARTKELSLAELPPTIKDAVAVTRSLGIRYLWVDALCIIQDSPTDKTNEIALMGEIYKNSTITVAAGNATSVGEGFLMRRSLPAACSLPFYVSEEQSGTVWLQDQKTFKRSPEPLDSRAWTLQEFLLSPRILYYGSHEIVWRCRTEHLKSWIYLTSWLVYPLPSTSYLPLSIFERDALTTSKTAQNQDDVWRTIIITYSKRNITLSEDRLPALAGIAAELQVLWNDKYVAGLWQKCLVRNLLWVAEAKYGSHLDKNQPLIRNCNDVVTGYQSPGWSWATYHYPIEIFKMETEVAEVIDFGVDLVSYQALFSSVSHGWLSLKGRLGRGDAIRGCKVDSFRYITDGRVQDESLINESTRVLLLGYGKKRVPYWGYALRPSGIGTYLRIGIAIVYLSSTASLLWPEGCKNQIVKII